MSGAVCFLWLGAIQGVFHAVDSSCKHSTRIGYWIVRILTGVWFAVFMLGVLMLGIWVEIKASNDMRGQPS